MLHALLTLAASEAEPSKTPFYIAGGVLAGWAVLLTAIGMTQPDFPSEGASKGVMLVSALLMAAAMVTAVTTA